MDSMQNKQNSQDWDDVILPFQLNKADVRGRVARLDRTLDEILGQHDYPVSVASQVAQSALLAALIGQTINPGWKLSLQIRSDGPLRIIATDYYAPRTAADPAQIRAYASFDRDAVQLRESESVNTPENTTKINSERSSENTGQYTNQDTGQNTDQNCGFDLLGKGMFAILIDQGKGTQPYQGITPLAGGSLSACASTYFAQSEQLPSYFVTKVAQSQDGSNQHTWRAGGIMLQHLPKASPASRGVESANNGLPEVKHLPEDEDTQNWNRALILLDTVRDFELIGPHVAQPQLLRRLFLEEQPAVFEPQPVIFGCTCSEDKIRQTLSIYSAKDLQSMMTDHGKITAGCQFCGRQYELEPSTVGKEAQNAP